MDYFKQFITPTHQLLIFSFLVALLIYSLVNKRKYKLPPGPRGLPILGYLPFLGADPALQLQELSKKYGDIFGVYLGRKLVVVVTDAAKAKELLSKPATSDRPKDLFIHLPGGGGFGNASGERWIEQRRYTIMEMKNLGIGRSHWENLVEGEVYDFLDILKKSQGQPVDIYKELAASISNNILSLVSGQRLPAGHPKREIIDQGIESFQLIYDQSGLISNYPTIFKFFVNIGLINAKEKLQDMVNFNKCIREEIEELRKDKDGGSYIHHYLAEIEKHRQSNVKNSFDTANLVGNVQALVIAGSDTTKVSLLWLFLAMASFPDIQDKVYKEVDTVLGKDGTANWNERNKLPYCHATILESQRWRTVAPLSLQHKINEDIEFYGYDFPKGTLIIALIAAFHNDTKYWKDPDAFEPERFLSEDGNVKEPEGFIPFSYGKRVCPGRTVAYIEIFHYFVAIIQKFRILPESETAQPDLTGLVGLTLQPKHQLLRFVPW